MSESKDDISSAKEEYRGKILSIVRHIENVQGQGILLAERLIDIGELELARRLIQRCFCHDNSKFTSIEYKYLGSDDKDKLKMAVDHHRAVNSHHPEHHINGVSDMTDLDLAEMVCDWRARSNEAGTNLRDWIKDCAMERFGFKQQSKCYQKIKK